MFLKLKEIFKSQKEALFGSFLLLAIFIMPFLSVAAKGEKLYVNVSASGTQDGTLNHPYKTINAAIKKAGKSDEIHISKGTYKENIKIPKGVEIFGDDKDDVIIVAKNHNEPVITMKDDTKIVGVTARKGRQGIRIEEGAKVKIIKCLIRDNEKDGIKIEGGSIKENEKIVISDNVIMNNAKAGVYSEKRKIAITNNAILKNGSDGIDLASGSDAWIQGNSLSKNGGSGMKFTLDKSNIWTKRNTLYKNEREGIEINAFGAAGRIDVFKSKFDQNGRWAISRTQRAGFAVSIWNGLTIQNNNNYSINKMGEVSKIVKIF